MEAHSARTLRLLGVVIVCFAVTVLFLKAKEASALPIKDLTLYAPEFLSPRDGAKIPRGQGKNTANVLIVARYSLSFKITDTVPGAYFTAFLKTEVDEELKVLSTIEQPIFEGEYRPSSRVSTLCTLAFGSHTASATIDATGVEPKSTTISFNVVPEPSTMLLLGSGLIGLVVVRRKLRRKP